MKLLAIALAGIIGLLIIVAWNICKPIEATKRKFRRFIINLAKKLEPEVINDTRSKIGSNLADIKKNIQSGETEAVRQKLENTYLKDKVKELETAKAALIEELSGSDYTSFEFDLWQQVIETIDVLISDRMRLLALIDTTVSFSRGANSSFDAESLVKKINELSSKEESLQNCIKDLTSSNKELSSERERLLLKEAKDLKNYRQEVASLQQSFSREFDSLKKTHNQEISTLNQNIKNIEDTSQEQKRENAQLLQHNSDLKDIICSQGRRILQQHNVIRSQGLQILELQVVKPISSNPSSPRFPGCSCGAERKGQGQWLAAVDFGFTESYYELRDVLDRQEYVDDHWTSLDDWD
jgi:hypothetical protein